MLHVLRIVVGAAMERSDIWSLVAKAMTLAGAFLYLHASHAVRQHCGGDGAPNYGMPPTAFGRG